MFSDIVATNARGESLATDVGEERLLASVRRILQESLLGAIATVAPDYRAHINIAYVAYTDDLRLCFLSHPNSRHCRNLDTNSSMAVSVFQSAQAWGGPDRGVQLFGSCHMATGNEAANAVQVYGERFGQYRKWAASLAEADEGREYRLFWFVAAEVKVSDEQQFGDGVLVTAAVQR